MFATMESILTWKERLDALEIGKPIEIKEIDMAAIYSAIQRNFRKEGKKLFSLRTNREDKSKKYLLRIK